MSGSLEKEEDHWRSVRDSFLSGISDRTRTMSVGALVAVWGLFTGKDSGSIVLSKASTRALLGVGVGAVMVLIFDLAEYSMGYQAARRKIPGEIVKPYTFNYDGWKRGFLWAKEIVGCSTLTALVILLLFLLSCSISHAQTTVPPYIGYWCGNDPNGNNWMGLGIEFESNTLTAEYRDKKGDGPHHCGVEILPNTENEHLLIECNKDHVYMETFRHGGFLEVHWSKNSNPGVSLLSQCKL